MDKSKAPAVQVPADPDRLFATLTSTEGFPHWGGSTWNWSLAPAAEDATDVLVHHSGLGGDYAELRFARCARPWARVLDRLADYGDDGVARPVFAAQPA